MEIVLASSNKHKVQEINDIIKTQYDNLSLSFILPPEDFNPIEDGTTFEENSYKKAYAAWECSHSWVLADDSGLCIEALNGKPGIFSARYAKTPAERISRVLNEMSQITNRNAYFTCAMTLINPQGKTEFQYTAHCCGTITESPRGKNGFGYDPIFMPNGYDKTIAEITEKEKNSISHRSIALKEVLNYISTLTV